MTAAIALERHGIDAHVFEQASELREVYQEQLRKGVALWKTTMVETPA